MALREELKQIYRNFTRDANILYEKIKLYPLISLLFIIAVLSLIVFPHWQVSGINNVTEKVTQENQSRAILAQIYGGIAIGIGIYFAWGNLSVARESQITERFNRAIGQLENEKLEIRLGGIHTLERIANESEKDYWLIMEILAAYVRINSPFKSNDKRPEIYENARDIQTDALSILEIMSQINVSPDVETIINIIRERKYRSLSYRDFNDDSKEVSKPKLKNRRNEYSDFNKNKLREPRRLDLQRTYLADVYLNEAHLEWVLLSGSFLGRAQMKGAHLENGVFAGVIFKDANLENADFRRALLSGANFERARLKGANLEKADLVEANLKGAKNLTIDQLLKVETLYKAELDPGLEEELRSKGYSHLLDGKF